MKRVYFVRHGETNGNLGGFWQGPEEPLNEKGRHQANVVATRAQNIDIDRLLSSTMTRAQQTAETISSATKLEIEFFDLFREQKDPTCVLGDNKGGEKDEIIERCTQERREHYMDPVWHFDDEENPTEFIARVREAMNFLSRRSEENIMVVSHGNFIRYFAGLVIVGEANPIEAAKRFKSSFTTSNTGITICTFEDGVWSLLTWNDHAHFAE